VETEKALDALRACVDLIVPAVTGVDRVLLEACPKPGVSDASGATGTLPVRIICLYWRDEQFERAAHRAHCFGQIEGPTRHVAVLDDLPPTDGRATSASLYMFPHSIAA
jgi:hypothetical protein